MNKKCIVLGAGFSKAIAGLPLTTEMFDCFEKEIYCRKKLSRTSSIVQRGEAIINFVNELKKVSIEDKVKKATNGNKDIKVINWRENFEGICSYIDLNLSFDVVSFTVDKNGEEGQLTTQPFELDGTSLKAVRRNIAFYLYLTLINRKGEPGLLKTFHEKYLQNNVTVITFNYDLVLENYLYEIGRWHPSSGYGIPFKLKSGIVSSLEILKLHGSLNWNANSSKLALEWDNFSDDGKFPNYPVDDLNIYCSPEAWMLPSFIKQFSYTELIQVWNQAAKQLALADEVIFIGYSLPLADSAVYSLFSTIDFTNKRIEIINSTYNIDELVDNYAKVLRKNKSEIKIITQRFEELLKNNE